MTEVRCPTCHKPVEWSPVSPWRPFCSERCKLIDLGEWIAEEHRIPAEPEDGQPFDLGDEATER